MKAHITVKIDVTTKKGTVQKTVWMVKRAIVYPHIVGRAWESAEGIISRYGQNPEKPTLPARYYATMLRDDAAPETLDGETRRDSAGYDGAPGELVFRGSGLGEINIEFPTDNAPAMQNYTKITVRGFATPTTVERELLQSQVVPALAAAALASRFQLRASAVERVKIYAAKNIAETRELLSRLEAEINGQLYKLEKGDD